MVSRECEFQKFIWEGEEFAESQRQWSNRVADYYNKYVFTD